ncbi:hypothetical protein J2S24_000831 [Thermoanaerobacter pentosaceus]|uniref:Uncharacterized protein n=1 Tax=Thermoanaerobacter pentosaceus TaxID=694059 RepID=A0ABT9M2L7_9THEO|nr:hypothetical protein [Thermoanaerobacter pentosaceus]
MYQFAAGLGTGLFVGLMLGFFTALFNFSSKTEK